MVKWKAQLYCYVRHCILSVWIIAIVNQHLSTVTNPRYVPSTLNNCITWQQLLKVILALKHYKFWIETLQETLTTTITMEYSRYLYHTVHICQKKIWLLLVHNITSSWEATLVSFIKYTFLFTRSIEIAKVLEKAQKQPLLEDLLMQFELDI